MRRGSARLRTGARDVTPEPDRHPGQLGRLRRGRDHLLSPTTSGGSTKCTQALLGSVGLSQRSLRDEFGIVGTAAVDASARFTAPVSYGDVLRATSPRGTMGDQQLHRVPSLRTGRGGPGGVEGREVRIWAKLEPDGRLRAEPIPGAFRRLFA